MPQNSEKESMHLCVNILKALYYNFILKTILPHVNKRESSTHLDIRHK